MDADTGPVMLFMGGGSSSGPRHERKEMTVKEYAKAEKVSEVTVRRWITKGALPVRRTLGGGVRIIYS